MTFKMIRRRHVLVGVVVVVLATAAGTAYAFSSGNSGNGPSASSDENLLRDFFRARLTAGGQPELAPADGARVSTSATTVDGAEWSLSTYPNRAGETCLSVAIPNEGRAYSCNSRAAMFSRGPLYVSWGSRQLPGGDLTKWDQAWVLGFSAAPVSTVELLYTDCTVKNLPLNADGAFHAVVGRSSMRRGSWPFVLRGVSASGGVVAEERADLEQPNAQGALIEEPLPDPGCS